MSNNPQSATAWPAISLAEAHARLTAPGAPFETETRVIRGITTVVWKNAPPTLRDLFLQARTLGDKTFVVYEDERVSYDAFARAALTRLAAALLAPVASAVASPPPPRPSASGVVGGVPMRMSRYAS